MHTSFVTSLYQLWCNHFECPSDMRKHIEVFVLYQGIQSFFVEHSLSLAKTRFYNIKGGRIGYIVHISDAQLTH